MCSEQQVDLGPLGQGMEASYSGEGVKMIDSLANIAYGGQVVLSETAWASVQDRLPGSTQVRIPVYISMTVTQVSSPVLLFCLANSSVLYCGSNLKTVN